MAVSLASEAARELVAAARQRYDWVIVDGGGLLAGAEAAIWAGLADCNLVVAARGSTSRRRLRQGLDVLEASGAAAIGLILNRAPEAGAYFGAGRWADSQRYESQVAEMRGRA